MEENKGHKIEWEKVIFLDHEKHWKENKGGDLHQCHQSNKSDRDGKGGNYESGERL